MSFSEILDQVQGLYDRKRPVQFSEVPKVLLYDFEKFVYGNTLDKTSKGKDAVYYSDFSDWYLKIKYKGFELKEDAAETNQDFQ